MVFLKYGYDFYLQIRIFLDPLNVEKVIPSFNMVTLRKLIIAAQFLVCHVSQKY